MGVRHIGSHRQSRRNHMHPHATQLPDPLPVPALAAPSHEPGIGVVVTRHQDVCAVLSDVRYEIPAVTDTAPLGTIAWLRGSVSRFTNGEDHARRRAILVGEAETLVPAVLRADAERRAAAIIDASAAAGSLEVMTAVARRVPMAVLAAALGAGDPDSAAAAAVVAAAAYFPGADPERERAGDDSTAELVRMLGPGDEEVIAARIAVLVQACDATAALIAAAVCTVLPPGVASGQVTPTDAIVAEVARLNPPARRLRRVSTGSAELNGCPVPAGCPVTLRLDSANRDPAAFQAPEEFRPGRDEGGSLTFGCGLRPCPGARQALALAAGVVQAIRDRCDAVVSAAEYDPSSAIRAPATLQVSLSRHR